MKPLKCCKNCEGLNKETKTFRNKLRCMFCDKYAKEMIDYFYNEQKTEKGCSTCKNCTRVENYPGFVTAEECMCEKGLKCDTVLFTIKNCSKWEGKFESI